MLCDFAQSVNGKLYILGGAWNQVRRSPGVQAFQVVVAAKLSVPWDLANHRMTFVLRMITTDGDEVMANDAPVEIQGQFEVARGLGMRQGTPLISAFTLPVALPELDAGSYVFELRIRDRIVATEPFTVA